MLEALQLVRAYTEGLSKVDFLNDPKNLSCPGAGAGNCRQD
jgi:hypothetical protein